MDESGARPSSEHDLMTARPAPAPGLVNPVQRKIAVGAVTDPHELEADTVAGTVVAALRRQSAAHEHGVGCGCGSPAASASVRKVRRHGAGAEHQHSDDVIGFEGGEVGAGTESALRASAGQGSALPVELRTPLESVFRADLSGVRLHADALATTLNQGMSALAFTHGSDIYFRDGLPKTSTDAGLHLLAHELTHTVQQGSSPVQRHRDEHENLHDTPTESEKFAGAIGVRRSAEPTVMRHAAYEHYLLGQLQPHEIASIPQVRKFANNKKQNKRMNKKGKGLDTGLKEGKTTKEDEDNVVHLIDQEMARLWKFKDNPEALHALLAQKGQVERSTTEVPLTEEENKKRTAAGKEPKKTQTVKSWNVPVVVLTCKGNQEVVVSYSEMNTMPDLFGNPEAIMATPKGEVLALLQGVRQQLYIELSKLREELTGKSGNKLYSKALDDDFEGAQGPRSQEVNAKAYEIRTEKQVNKATTRKGEESEQYFAALERNACHFAPESWRQWRSYHVEAVRLAKQSALDQRKADSGQADGTLDDKTIQILQKNAARLSNEAMIQNSFGEHYLQDSFASGHLIDKTKIMQWFTRWLERSGKGLGTGGTAVAQWKMAVHAAGLDLKSNPQMLHDKMVRGQLKSATHAASEIGASSTPSIELMVRWRAHAKAKPKGRSLSAKEAAGLFGLNVSEATFTMKLLVKKGMASKDFFGDKYTLSSAQLETVAPLTGAKAPQGTNPYTAKMGASPSKDGAISDEDAAQGVAEFNLAAYNMMMSNAYIGSSTKFFHDKFCKEGLEVVAGTGDDLGRIYGDSNMMNAGGQKGLRFAAETSRRSRSSIFNIISGETLDEKYTTDEIAKRFPDQVKVDGEAIDIVDFNEHLRVLGNKRLFKEAQTAGALLVYKAMGGISDKGAIDVDKFIADIQTQVGVLDSADSF
ncbi:MAG: hypothetical protein JWM76_3814 [Pseudonocardiales bacterium]|nr:hypothetical protein [Pseudonocardiales bacterium]